MFNPQVSIIIPVYNGADYMREAIDSALAQTYDNCEVIVVNDGSTDGGETESIAGSYGDKIRYIWKENGGVATALNLGIEKMTGEYFSWLSHDDVYYPDKIEIQIEHLKNRSNKDVILYSNVEYIDENSKFISVTSHEKCHDLQYLNSKVYPVIKGLTNGCSLLIPKRCFDEVGLFNEKLATANDYDMWFRIFRLYEVEFIQKVLIKYRSHKNQGTKIHPIYIKESNDLWSMIINDLSDEEILKFEKSLFDFYYKIAEQMKCSAYNDAYLTAIDHAKKCYSEKNPKISVIMPCYNAEKYIAEAIESILTQTFYDFELIIADDFSEDNSREIINNYCEKDFRVKYIKNQNQKGICGAMNTGLDLAKGEYITRMDSDDISMPQRLEKQLKFLDNNKEYGICSVNMLYINSNGDNISSQLFVDSKVPLDWLFLWENPISNAPSMYRSELLKKNEIYFNNLIAAEDYDFLCRLILITRVHMIGEVLYKYRLHNQSVFWNNTEKAYVNSIEISRNLARELTGKTAPSLHNILIKFDAALKNEIRKYSVIDISYWMKELLNNARNKWNWNEEEYNNAFIDAENRISNYIYSLYWQSQYDQLKSQYNDLEKQYYDLTLSRAILFSKRLKKHKILFKFAVILFNSIRTLSIISFKMVEKMKIKRNT